MMRNRILRIRLIRGSISLGIRRNLNNKVLLIVRRKVMMLRIILRRRRDRNRPGLRKLCALGSRNNNQKPKLKLKPKANIKKINHELFYTFLLSIIKIIIIIIIIFNLNFIINLFIYQLFKSGFSYCYEIKYRF